MERVGEAEGDHPGGLLWYPGRLDQIEPCVSGTDRESAPKADMKAGVCRLGEVPGHSGQDWAGLGHYRYLDSGGGRARPWAAFGGNSDTGASTAAQ